MEINEYTNILYSTDNSTFDSCSKLFRYYKHNPMELESELMDEQDVYLKMGQNQIC